MKFKKNLIKAGHMTALIMFDGGSAKDKMKSNKDAVMLHRTTKDLVIKSDTFGLEN